MKEVTVGETETFDVIFRDNYDQFVDPTEVECSIVYNASDILVGPLKYSKGEIQRVTAGHYRCEFKFQEYYTPAIYNVKWEGIRDNLDPEDVSYPGEDLYPGEDFWPEGSYIDFDTRFFYEIFELKDIIAPASTILDPPRTHGLIRESFRYRDMGLGATDRIFLVGHADGLDLNDPYQVNNMQTAINILGANQSSPLVKALLEAYNAGARDIWLVAAAPMKEYVPATEDRFEARDDLDGETFYERYYDRLEITYKTIIDWDVIEILVPLDAPFYDAGGIDFLTPLVYNCAMSFQITGSPRLGLISTKVSEVDSDPVQAMITDDRLDNIGSMVAIYGDGYQDLKGEVLELADPQGAGKFAMILSGEGTITQPQFTFAYSNSVTTIAAAVLAANPVNRGLTYCILPNVSTPLGKPLLQSEIEGLANKRINPLIRTTKSKRGMPYYNAIASDNTLAVDNSDFWSIVQMRLVNKVAHGIKTLGKRHLGTVGYGQFKHDVNNFLYNITMGDVIRGFDIHIERDLLDMNKVIVEVNLRPYFGVREISFAVTVGPGT